MENAYAQALWRTVENGMAPKKAVEALHEALMRTGRTALMPRIAHSFARLAARESGKDRLVLSVAREKDERKAKAAAKEVLAQLGAKAGEMEVAVDESLIGGWRLEGREILHDASWKKDLLSIYNRATQ